MPQTYHRTIFQSTSNEVGNRIDELIEQFNKWIVGESKLQPITLLFYASEQYPLSMSELTRFLSGCPYFNNEYDVEWYYKTDSLLGPKTRLEILDRSA